jgi:hypothetical protein
MTQSTVKTTVYLIRAGGDFQIIAYKPYDQKIIASMGIEMQVPADCDPIAEELTSIAKERDDLASFIKFKEEALDSRLRSILQSKGNSHGTTTAQE